MNKAGLPIIISAPSGTGKTTTSKRLKERFPALKIAISHTTRKIRDGELEGVDYYFISNKEFEAKREKSQFLEWAQERDPGELRHQAQAQNLL